MINLQNIRYFVNYSQLNKLIKLKGRNNVKIFEIGYNTKQLYDEYHLPNAQYIDAKEFENNPIQPKKTFSELKQLIEKYSLSYNPQESTNIFYNHIDNMLSSKFALALIDIGYTNFKIYDGGKVNYYNDSQKYQSQKQTEQNEVKTIEISNDVEEFQNKIELTEKNLYLTAQEAFQLSSEKKIKLIDVRTLEEHKSGRPQNSQWGENSSEYRQKETQKKLTNQQIIEKWENLKIDYKNQNLCFFCRKGYRSAEVFMYAQELGLTNVTAFNGWDEWVYNGLEYENK